MNSTPEEYESEIREKRIVEATKKGLTGQKGKIGIVLRTLGEPLIDQSEGGTHIDRNYLYSEENDRKIEEAQTPYDLMKFIPFLDIGDIERPESEEWSEVPEPIPYDVTEMGWHFDGLNRGMHLEIKYDDSSTELTVHYKGYLVYKEIKGELLAYVPINEWEEWIDKLYKVAKEKHRYQQEKEFQESVQKAEKEKKTWWQKMKMRWGV